MCDDCYDNTVEHTWHYHRICDDDELEDPELEVLVFVVVDVLVFRPVAEAPALALAEEDPPYPYPPYPPHVLHGLTNVELVIPIKAQRANNPNFISINNYNMNFFFLLKL